MDEREELFAQQRAERGWDDSELWNLDKTVAEFVLPRLRRFREHAFGYPADLDAATWDRYLGQMVDAFDLLASNKVYYDAGEQQRIRRGLRLFSRHYQALWQ